MSDSKPKQAQKGLRILRNAMVPLVDEHGKARHFGPYKPTLDACKICPARCCRYTVKVSIVDAVEFCVTLGLPFFAGLQLVMSEKERSFRVDHDAQVFQNVDPDYWQGSAEIALKRREDGACAHLLDIGGFERCGVYSARPSTCRLYPIVWESEEARGGPAVISCPVAYAVTPKMEEAFYFDAEQSIERWKIHDEILRAWHERSEDESLWGVLDFLEFAVPLAASHLGIEAADVLRSGGPFDVLSAAMVESGTLR
jgi:Fe-S-cluster containining protein